LTLEEVEKATSVLTASVASAYGLSTRELTLLNLNSALSDLDDLLQLNWGCGSYDTRPGIQHV